VFDIGFQELIIIFVVALLVFGPDKLPELARNMGKWMAEIRRGVYMAKSQIDNELNTEFKMPDDEIIKNLPKEERTTDSSPPDSLTQTTEKEKS